MPARLLALPLVLCLLLVACGKDSPTEPSPTPDPPAPTTVSLTGRVSANTGEIMIGARLRILDGANAGRTTTTNSSGTYTFTGLTRSNANIEATFTDYSSDRKGVFIDGTNTLDFVLSPVPRPPFTRSGTGNTVFDMPRTVRRVRIQGRYTGRFQNFIVWIDDDLEVNTILGTGADSTRYDGVHATTGGQVEIRSSEGVSWSFTEVR